MLARCLAHPTLELERLKQNPVIQSHFKQWLPACLEESRKVSHVLRQIAFGRALEIAHVFAESHKSVFLGDSGNKTLTFDIFSQILRPNPILRIPRSNPLVVPLVLSQEDCKELMQFFGYEPALLDQDQQKGCARRFLLEKIQHMKLYNTEIQEQFVQDFERIDRDACATEEQGSLYVGGIPHFRNIEPFNFILPAMSDPAYNSLVRKVHALIRKYEPHLQQTRREERLLYV